MIKNIITALFICISLIQCNAQHRKNNTTKEKNTQTTKKMNPYQYLINKSIEKFDSVTYSQKKNKSFLYQYNSSNGNIIQMLSSNSGKSSKEYIQNTYYMIYKGYYPNGNIETKGILSNQANFRIGIWYEFDKDGKFVKEVDHDKGYDFSLENVIAFCEKEGYPMAKDYQRSYENSIRKDSVGERKFWVIEYSDQDMFKESFRKRFQKIERSKDVVKGEPHIYVQTVLDGKTGKVVSKKVVGMDNVYNDSYKDELSTKKSTSQRSGSFLADPNEKGTFQKEELGKAFTSTSNLPKDTYQIYEGKAYTKAECNEFQGSLPWWKKIL